MIKVSINILIILVYLKTFNILNDRIKKKFFPISNPNSSSINIDVKLPKVLKKSNLFQF